MSEGNYAAKNSEDAAEIDALKQRIEMLDIEKKDLELFNYSAAHDLYAPLTRIEGYSEILLSEYSGALDVNGRSYLKRVSHAAQQAKSLVNDLLNLSRVVHFVLNKQKVNLSELAEEILQEYSHEMPNESAKFVVHPDIVVDADLMLMRILMINLLGNARKYTKKNRESMIEVGVEEQDGELVYYVADDGIGFEQDKAELIFSAFHRISNSSDYEGSGVGLATAQRIILRHGGRIWAHGRPGHGATFYFTLTDH